MYGEIESKTLNYDLDKVKYYLRKIYDSNQQIDTKIAESFETIANESKKRAEVSKAMKDMGIIGMGQGNKMMDIKKLYEYSVVRAEIYFLEAINSYEKINNKEKAEELKKEME